MDRIKNLAHTRTRLALLLPLGFILVGCGATGVRPEDKSYDEHMAQAKRQEAEAKEHDRLAESAVSDPTVAKVEDIEGGVRVIFADGPDPDPAVLARHATCHAAHGAYWGRKGMAGCPLYTKGLTTRAVREGGHTVLILTTKEATELPVLRQRAHAFQH